MEEAGRGEASPLAPQFSEPGGGGGLRGSNPAPQVSVLLGWADQPLPQLHLRLQIIFSTNVLEIMNSGSLERFITLDKVASLLLRGPFRFQPAVSGNH